MAGDGCPQHRYLGDVQAELNFRERVRHELYDDSKGAIVSAAVRRARLVL